MYCAFLGLQGKKACVLGPCSLPSVLSHFLLHSDMSLVEVQHDLAARSACVIAGKKQAYLQTVVFLFLGDHILEEGLTHWHPKNTQVRDNTGKEMYLHYEY